MSEKTGEFLTRARELVASGESIYGAVGSPKQVAKLAELDAKIALGRRLGEIEPAAEPWTEARAAKERLAAEFPFGEPAAALPDHLATHFATRLESLTQRDPRELARLADEVAAEIENRPSAVSVRHGRYDRTTGRTPGGRDVVRSLLADGAPVIAALAPADREAFLRALRADRQMLETFAARGQEVARYAARKKELGQ